MSTALPFRTPPPGPDPTVLSDALQSCPESIAIIQQGNIFYANPAFARLFGYTAPGELEGLPLSDLLPKHHRCAGRPHGFGRTVDRCGYPGCQFDGRRKDETRSRMESSCAEFRSGGESFRVLTARDVTRHERRRIVRDSVERYRAIFDASAIGIVQCTVDGRVVESNPAVERMLGYTHAELRGMHFRDFTHSEDFPADLQLFSEMVAGKRDHYQMELRFLRKDKTYGWIKLTVSLVRGPDREPEFVIGLTEDITEHKSAEAQLREAQKMEVLGRLVGGVSHDFNNLLTAIALYTDLIGAGLESTSRLQRHVSEIRLAGEQGAALIQQLLAMVRQQRVEPRLVDINQLIAAMRNLLSRLIGDNVALHTVLEADPPCVLMDPTQMQQVVLNLVLNSRDAMRNGGHITIQTRGPLGCPDPLPAPAARLEVTVTDDGCGMDEETRSHLFEPFFTTKVEGRGNGLGLATVRNIVKQSGGDIQVETEPGRGTSVTILLPSADHSAMPAAAENQRELATNRRETILLVEDDEQVRDSAQSVLRKYGYKVLTARNGAEALLIDANHGDVIDLVITDLVMPGMSGREVVDRLCQTRPRLKIIGASGFEHTPLGPPQNNSFVLFPKPFTAESLARKVREVLNAGCSEVLAKKG